MAEPPTFEQTLEEFRGRLLALAREGWDEALRAWGEPSDMVQNTLVEALERRQQFRGQTPAQLAVWLRVTLAHNMADAIRRVKRQKRDYRLERRLEATFEASSARLGDGLAADDPSPSKWAVIQEDLARLAHALAQLPDDQAEAVTLHQVRGLSLAETASRMERSEASVAGLYHRGVSRIRKLMAER